MSKTVKDFKDFVTFIKKFETTKKYCENKEQKSEILYNFYEKLEKEQEEQKKNKKKQYSNFFNYLIIFCMKYIDSKTTEKVIELIEIEELLHEGYSFTVGLIVEKEDLDKFHKFINKKFPNAMYQEMCAAE
jgi:hypothetical protein